MPPPPIPPRPNYRPAPPAGPPPPRGAPPPIPPRPGAAKPPLAKWTIAALRTDERFGELVAKVDHSVHHRSAISRMKAGAQTFFHTDMASQNRGAQVGFVVQQGAITGVAIVTHGVLAAALVGAGVATGGIGVIVAVVGALGVWGVKKAYNASTHKNMKDKVLAIAQGGLTQPSGKVDSTMQANATALLGALVYDLKELKTDVETENKAREKAGARKIDRAIFRSVFTDPACLAAAKNRINRNAVVSFFSTDKNKTGLVRVQGRTGRVRIYLHWLLGFVELLEKEALAQFKDAATKAPDLANAIRELLNTPGHLACASEMCFGPWGNDLTLTRAPDQVVIAARAQFDAAMTRYAVDPSGQGRLATVTTTARNASARLGESAEDRVNAAAEFRESETGGMIADSIKGLTELIDDDGQKAGASAGLGAALELGGTVNAIYHGNRRKAVVEGVGAAVSTGADAGMDQLGDHLYGAFGGADQSMNAAGMSAAAAGGAAGITATISGVVSFAVSRTKASFTTNRPILKAVTASLGKPADHIDKELKELTDEPDKAMLRMLEKASYHYPVRIGEKANKLAEDMKALAGNKFTNCTEAVSAWRHLAKVDHYAEKQLLYLRLLKLSLEALEEKVKTGEFI